MSTPATAPVELDIPVGAPCWIDLLTSDMEKSVDFYGAVFGWKANETPPEFGGYRYFEKDGKAVGGAMLNDPQWNAPDGWSIHLKTLDARRTAELAEQFGGKVTMEPMDVFDNGSFVVLTDAGGASISAWQPGTEKGFGVLREPGAPVHFELHTRDYDKVLEFYAGVFGWTIHKMSDEPEFRYATFSEDPMNARAGIMDASAFPPEFMPTQWSVYIGTEDVEATVKVIQRKGGQVVQGPDETPYGTLASCTDPTGALFKLRG